MSKMITVQDDTYYLIKACAQKWKSSLSGTVKQAIKFSIEAENTKGSAFNGNPELMDLYNKAFVEKPVSDLDVFKRKILDYISKCDDVKSNMANFISCL